MNHLLKMFCILSLPFFVINPINKQFINANDLDQSPDLTAYQEDNHVKLEWAVEMLDEDVLYETGFEEEDLLPALHYGGSATHLPENRWYGGQSFTTEEKFKGNRSLKVINTYENSNIFSTDVNGGVVQTAVYSRSAFINDRYYMGNGTDLSLSFRAKTTGTGNLRFSGTGGQADYGDPLDITFIEDVKVGDETAKVSDPIFFKEYVDQGKKFHLANMKGAYTKYIYVTHVDIETKTITLSSSFQGEFNKGDKVLRHRSKSPIEFPARTFSQKQDWELFNVNTRVKNYADYNTLNRGFYLSINTTTKDTVYIDDLKMGYATKTELFRDNKQIYEGKLSDFEDKKATDKAKPNKVIDYSVTISGNKQQLNIVEPKDNGTSYKYKVRAISNDNSGVYESKEKTVNVVSGIEGYSYVIDKNTETIPNGQINNKDGEIELNQEIYKDHYLHIQAIDKEGNKSEVSHIKLDKVKDITPPTIELSQSANKNEWTNKGVLINIKSVDLESGIKTVSFDNNKKSEIGRNILKSGKVRELKPNNATNTPIIRNYMEDEDELYLRVTNQKDTKISTYNFLYHPNTTEGFINDVYGVEQFKVGDKFMFSADVRVPEKSSLRLGATLRDTELQGNSKIFNINTTNEWVRLEVPVEVRGSFEIINLILNSEEKLKSVDSKNFKLEKGDVSTPYTSAFEDDIIEKIWASENGTYTFTATDEAGNKTTQSMEISNIDKIKPTVQIKEEESKIKIWATDEGGSEVKSINYCWSEEKDDPGSDCQSENKNSLELDRPESVGYHYLHTYSEDNAGNKSEWVVGDFTNHGSMVMKVDEESIKISHKLTGVTESINYQMDGINILDSRLVKDPFNVMVSSTSLKDGGNEIGYFKIDGESTKNNVVIGEYERSGVKADKKYTIKPKFRIDLPPTTVFGEYRSTMTFTVSSGP